MRKPCGVCCSAHRPFILSFLAVICLIATLHGAEGSLEGEVIGEWAETFGEELWDLGQRITKAPDIKARYKELNVRVESKDGPSLLKSAVETVGLMLKTKMDAVRCIQMVAETLAEEYEFNHTQAENLTYYSAKYSSVDGSGERRIPDTLRNNTWLYRNMSFNVDTHFYNIPVNTSYSSVHVPTNVYDRSPLVLETIDWSEALDDVFAQNYKSDPALSWQYFGSSTGVMRQYPAIAWPPKDADLFDCRTRSWFIEAATCSKDVVILFDNSGSMSGYRNFIATFTVKAILATFSNNDFVNIFSFSNDTFETVDCFKDTLVQATPDNLRTFNEALKPLKPDGHANFTLAFMKAFELLESYRLTRGCNGTIVGCNQVIMLITDGVPGNLTHVFDMYNRQYNPQENDTHIPVRVFTYLIGKEVTNVREIQWMACLNRGYYVHIQSLDEVQEKVLKYIDVIARPLVLQEVDHPITWTHAYVDITDKKVATWLWDIAESKRQRQKLFDNVKSTDPFFSKSIGEDSFTKMMIKNNSDPTNVNQEEFRLMTSVAIPLYDTKINKLNDTRTAYLLGVAGTDVPVDEIDRLTLPYKLGVNGYSFIVSNNGYLLLHPDLRPVYKGILKENYNSIDVVEVEMVDDDLGLRELGPTILELRESMVGDKEGSMLGVKIRFHYDSMRRVSKEMQDYYFAPLPNTPFSLGIVLPSAYGNTWIKVGDEIKRNQHLGLKVEDFFKGNNWKIHPKWVYCKYHYLEGHEFSTPEAELLHFLHKLEDPNWKWSEQYVPEPDTDDNPDDGVNCGRKTLDDGAYYCNRELIQLLVFDAKVTDPSYNTWTFRDKAEEELFLRYNASLRFAATMSGLTRWQFVFGEDESNTDSEFGDIHTQAIDETWYKSAILQHQVQSESFAFSVDFDAGSQNPENVNVTASHAVFPKDGGLQAPAAVLGYQFSHYLLYQRFMDITSKVKVKCGDCMKACDSDEQDCYVIDSSGYVILSETFNDTGKFFGEVDGAIMESMVNADIFQKVSVFDLQGVCFYRIMKSSAGNILTTPFHWFALAVQWFGAQLGWLLLQANISLLWRPLEVLAQQLEDDDDEYYDGYDSAGDTPRTPPPHKVRKNYNLEEEEYFSRPRPEVWEEKNFPCDRQADLFVLQQQNFIQSDGFFASGPTNCSRPYYVKRIPYSNLIMVVVNTMYSYCYRRIQATTRHIGDGPEGPPCHKLQLANLPRRRLEGCYTDHKYEQEIEDCGRGSTIYISFYLLIICWTMHLFKRFIL